MHLLEQCLQKTVVLQSKDRAYLYVLAAKSTVILHMPKTLQQTFSALQQPANQQSNHHLLRIQSTVPDLWSTEEQPCSIWGEHIQLSFFLLYDLLTKLKRSAFRVKWFVSPISHSRCWIIKLTPSALRRLCVNVCNSKRSTESISFWSPG